MYFGVISGGVLSFEIEVVAVAGMGRWVNGRWKWGDFGVSVSNSATAATTVQHLRRFLQPIQPADSCTDHVLWAAAADHEFSVKSCYDIYNVFHFPFDPEKEFDKYFYCL